MKNDAISSRNEIDIFTRILHLGLVFFGLLALVTGDFADDYKKVGGLGFIVHGWIGIGITFFISLRFMYGIWDHPMRVSPIGFHIRDCCTNALQ